MDCEATARPADSDRLKLSRAGKCEHQCVIVACFPSPGRRTCRPDVLKGGHACLVTQMGFHAH
eukprot:10031348-Prorocentrum_lima.AAC.1